MRKIKNAEHVEGYLFEQNLALKTVQKKESKNFGKEFINGTIDVQTDEEGLNVVPIHFSYVSPVFSSGRRNETFYVLKRIIEEGKTVSADGKDSAMKVKVDTAFDLNDFYTFHDEEKLVSAKRNEGGFVSLVQKLSEEEKGRSTFEFDMFINKAKVVEADPEKNIDQDYLVLSGATFNFRNAILPTEVVVKSAGGIKYFENCNISKENPLFTKVWGNISNLNIVKKVEQENAFGESEIKEFSRTVREWVVVGAAKEPYPIGDEKDGVTAEEIQKAIADREVYLAEKKEDDRSRMTERVAAGDTAASAPVAAATAANGAFDF